MKNREKLEVLVHYLAKKKYINSIAPRRDIARELEEELNESKIPKEEHFLAVMNMYPREL